MDKGQSMSITTEVLAKGMVMNAFKSGATSGSEILEHNDIVKLVQEDSKWRNVVEKRAQSNTSMYLKMNFMYNTKEHVRYSLKSNTHNGHEICSDTEKYSV